LPVVLIASGILAIPFSISSKLVLLCVHRRPTEITLPQEEQEKRIMHSSSVAHKERTWMQFI